MSLTTFMIVCTTLVVISFVEQQGTVLNVHDTNNAEWAIVRPEHCQRTFFILLIMMIIVKANDYGDAGFHQGNPMHFATGNYT